MVQEPNSKINKKNYSKHSLYQKVPKKNLVFQEKMVPYKLKNLTKKRRRREEMAKNPKTSTQKKRPLKRQISMRKR